MMWRNWRGTFLYGFPRSQRKSKYSPGNQGQDSCCHEAAGLPSRSLARSLANGLSGAIGVVVDAKDAEAFSNVFFSRSLFAIEQAAQERGYDVLIANGGTKHVEAVEALVLQKKVDGLILPPSTASQALINKIKGFPLVVLGQPDASLTNISWVDNNNQQGAEMAVNHLYEKGYKQIAYLGGDPKLGFVNRRVKGYQGTLRPKISDDSSCDSSLEAAIEAGTGLLKMANPRMLCCAMTISLPWGCCVPQNPGHPVPEQLGVAAFDNYPLAAYTEPSLTAIDIDTALLGKQTASLCFSGFSTKPPTNRFCLVAH